ncbi:hypothetical protein [Calidifontibacter terrae]
MRRRLTGPTALGSLVGLLAGIAALGPALRPGYLLFYDMVFVPQLPLSERTLGIDGSVPRAVPGDLVVSLLSFLAPGWLVQKALLLVVFVGVAAGAASFFRSRVGAVAAAIAAAWNPYVGERLAIGHWGFLLGYACLPFLARAVAAHRRGEYRGTFRLLLWTLLTALTGSTGAVIGLLVTAAVLLAPTREPSVPGLRRFGLPIGAFLVANSAWWFPFLVLAPRDAADPAGVEAFMARADTPYGVIGSLLTGGGIWNQGVWFPGRNSVLATGLALLAVTAVLVVAGIATRQRREAAVTGLVIAGGIGLLIAAAGSLPGGTTLVTRVVTDVPGGGLLRDAQKFVAPWMLVVALGFGWCAQELHRRGVQVGAAKPIVLGLVSVVAAWPVLTFSGMAAGADGAWRAVDYPPAYPAMADRIDHLEPGSVAVFPWNLYRRYAWDHRVVALDPWQRLVDRSVVVNDDLPLSDRGTVAGESAAAARVTTAFRTGGDVVAALRAAGVRYVLVQSDQPPLRPAPVAKLTPIAAKGDLALYKVPGAAIAAARPEPAYRWLGLAGLPLALLAMAVAAFTQRRRLDRPESVT